MILFSTIKNFQLLDHQFSSQIFLFLKAVNDPLIEPDIQCWDYYTVKHIAGQGPIYISVHKKLKVKGHLLVDDDSDSEDNEIHFPSVPVCKKVY